MKGFVIILTLVFVPALAGAQYDLAVQGIVKDEQNQSVPYANIAVYTASDSVLVNGAVSDNEGRFEIALNPGTYFLKISFLSFQAKIINNLIVSSKDINLGTIALKASSDILEEVVIEGEKSPMELHLDKRVFNVSQDLGNVGANAADILGNLPSVTVDIDGAVSLRGSENVVILINGRPSGLTSRDPDALRKLQGNLVERVEVITNPSSRYDAAGEVGIINIILKKENQNGVNGSFTAMAGYPYLIGGSYSINYRKNNINLFSTYGIDDRRTPGYGHSSTQYTGADTSFVYTQESDRSRAGLSHNLSVGLDYYMSEKSILTGSFMFNPSTGLNKSTTLYQDFDENGVPTNTTKRTESEEEDEEEVEATLSFKNDFKKAGQSLAIDFKWIKDVDNETTDYTEGPENGPVTLQHAVNNANETNWLVQSDYLHPFGKDGKMEAGLKTATRIIQNEYSLEQLVDDNWIAFPSFTNNMVYTEHIHAAYLMASNTYNRISLQGGLRGEYSDIETELTETNEVNTQQYFNVFPSANVSYKLKENNTLQLSYSYRISRPNFRNLLPFSDFRDSRVFFVGNPNLKPEYTSSYEVGYLLDWQAGSLLSNAYYRYRTDVIQRIVTGVDSSGRTQVVPINMAEENGYGLEFNFSISVADWWKLNTNANFFRAITEGQYEDQELYSDTYSWTARLTSKMTIVKSLDFQASFNYRGPRITPQGKDLALYGLDLAVSHDLFKGRGTLSASVRDLFNTRIRKSVVDNDGYYSYSQFQWQSRQVIVTFSYRLNRTKEKEDDDDQERGEDEF